VNGSVSGDSTSGLYDDADYRPSDLAGTVTAAL
jgi:hypothetical protein